MCVCVLRPAINEWCVRADEANYGFDDERGDYKPYVHDHLAYQFEIISILGKGSFGQVHFSLACTVVSLCKESAPSQVTLCVLSTGVANTIREHRRSGCAGAQVLRLQAPHAAGGQDHPQQEPLPPPGQDRAQDSAPPRPQGALLVSCAPCCRQVEYLTCSVPCIHAHACGTRHVRCCRVGSSDACSRTQCR